MTIQTNSFSEPQHAAFSQPDADLGAAQGARRATEAAPRSASRADAPPAAPADPGMQVHASVAKRRRFSNPEKRRILSAADACQQPGDIGALMRREGIYSSHLSNWRKQRDAGLLGGNNAPARGPKADPVRAHRLVVEALQRDNARLQRKFDQAMLLIDFQKKVSMLIGLALPQSSATT